MKRFIERVAKITVFAGMMLNASTMIPKGSYHKFKITPSCENATYEWTIDEKKADGVFSDTNTFWFPSNSSYPSQAYHLNAKETCPDSNISTVKHFVAVIEDTIPKEIIPKGSYHKFKITPSCENATYEWRIDEKKADGVFSDTNTFWFPSNSSYPSQAYHLNAKEICPDSNKTTIKKFVAVIKGDNNDTHIDTTPPVIDINGDNPININLNQPYNDAGATATDNIDGDITSNIKVVSNVDTSKVGTYSVVYSIKDSAGNEANATRIVKVIEKPKIVLFINKNKNDFVTNQDYQIISGYVYSSMNNSINKVICENSLNDTKVIANGKKKWDANISLDIGDNPVQCHVITLNGQNIATKTVIITYYPNSSFTMPLSFNENTYFNDEDKKITVHIGIDYNTSKNIDVKLYKVDSDNKLMDVVGNIKDDGTLPDEIDKDGVFTAQFTLENSNFGKYCYRVGVKYGMQEEYFSSVKCITIVKHITQDQMQDFMSIGEDIQKIYAENNNTKIAAQKAYDALKNDPRIGAIGINDDKESLWYVSIDGIAGGYSVFKEGKKSTPRVKSKKGIIISPFIENPNGQSWGKSQDDYSRVWKDIKAKKSCRLKTTTEKINNGSVSIQIDDFKHLSDYSYIHISTHGDNWYNGLINLWHDEWGNDIWLDSISEVVLYTGNKISKDANGSWIYGKYEKDIITHRIVVHGSGLLVITPSFIDRYVSSLPNSIVVLSACRSAINGSMANAFISKGAKTVLGYTDYVYTGYSQDTTSSFMKELLSDKTTQEAFNTAVKLHGIDDGNYGSDSDHARFRLFGDQNLKLASGKLFNLGFEEGSLKPWKSVGDGRFIAQLGSSKPTEGQYMGIVSTGLGYTTEAGSIEQVGCLENNETTLSFDWNFFSEEFKEYCNSVYQDTFKVVVCETNDVNGTITKTNCSTLFNKTIDDLCGSVTKVDNKFDQGDVYATGWQTQDIDISSYAGKSISLQFYSTDVGDSIYDSAILIDNIKFK